MASCFYFNFNHPSQYIFPATQHQKKLGQDLKESLRTPSEQSGLSILHQLVKSILLAQPVKDRCHSKWDSMMECFLAISGLREDGNFKQPHEVTQMFAQLVYLIRCTILYEALDNVAEFNDNPYE